MTVTQRVNLSHPADQTDRQIAIEKASFGFVAPSDAESETKCHVHHLEKERLPRSIFLFSFSFLSFFRPFFFLLFFYFHPRLFREVTESNKPRMSGARGRGRLRHFVYHFTPALLCDERDSMKLRSQILITLKYCLGVERLHNR